MLSLPVTLAWVALHLLLILVSQTQSFSSSSPRALLVRVGRPCTVRTSSLILRPALQDDEHKSDADMYDELRRKKNELLGAPIPPEQARRSAESAEREFLAAMKESTEEFESIKKDQGSDRAVEIFIEKIVGEEEEEEGPWA